jgi:chromatin remodeling complex protein RSC6
MFAQAPKIVEYVHVRKGRKNKDIAKEHFDDSLEKSILILDLINDGIALKDPTPVEMRKQLRTILRKAKEVKKHLEKYNNLMYKPKRTRTSHNTGLEKLRPISMEMALFADWEYGVTRKSRQDVTKDLCDYIRNNNLRDEDNKAVILPDAKLKKLLQIDDDVILRYPTMQKYLFNCFEEETEPPPEEEDEDDEPIKKETAKKEPIKKEPIKKETAKKEPIKKEPAKKEPVKKEPVKKGKK